MNEKVLKWLWDVKLAIDEIESFFNGQKMIFAEYTNNLVLKRASERNLEIIGLRNQIIHAYDNISDENIWTIVIKHLPRLKEEVDSIINDFPTP